MVGTPRPVRKTTKAGPSKPHEGGGDPIPALFAIPTDLDKSLQEKTEREMARQDAFTVPLPDDSDFEGSGMEVDSTNEDETTANAGAAFNAAAKTPSSKRKSVDTSPKDNQEQKKNRTTSPSKHQEKTPHQAPGKTNIHNATKVGNNSKNPPKDPASKKTETPAKSISNPKTAKENLTMWAHLTKQMPGINVEVAEMNGLRGYFIWPSDASTTEAGKLPEMTTTTTREEIPPVNYATTGTGNQSVLEGMNNIKVTVPNPVKTVTTATNSAESIILGDLAKGVTFDAREQGQEDITINTLTLKLPGQFYTQVLKLNPKIKTAKDLIIHMASTNMTLKRLNRSHILE